MTAMETSLPYLERDTDRHGNPRVYVRRNGRRIRIKAAEGTVAFAKAYSDALERLDTRAPAGASAPLTVHPKASLGWLGARYFASREFGLLAKESQRARRNCLEECFREPLSEDDPEPMGNCPLKYVTAQKVRRLVELKPDEPGAAANRRKHLSALCGWGVDHDHLTSNPARDVKTVKSASVGYYPWTMTDLAAFETRHPIGTKARLAMGLLLFLGPRRQDMVGFGKQHVKDGVIGFVPKKTRKIRPEMSYKPILPILADIIAASPCGDLTFLVTTHGKAFTANGFGNKMREWCDQAGLSQCTAHGLRKLGATIAAENGATLPQLMAMFDWSSPRIAMKYIEAANKKKMAGQGMGLIGSGYSENGDLSHPIVAPKISTSNQ